VLALVETIIDTLRREYCSYYQCYPGSTINIIPKPQAEVRSSSPSLSMDQFYEY